MKGQEKGSSPFFFPPGGPKMPGSATKKKEFGGVSGGGKRESHFRKEGGNVREGTRKPCCDGELRMWHIGGKDSAHCSPYTDYEEMTMLGRTIPFGERSGTRKSGSGASIMRWRSQVHWRPWLGEKYGMMRLRCKCTLHKSQHLRGGGFVFFVWF